MEKSGLEKIYAVIILTDFELQWQWMFVRCRKEKEYHGRLVQSDLRRALVAKQTVMFVKFRVPLTGGC